MNGKAKAACHGGRRGQNLTLSSANSLSIFGAPSRAGMVVIGEPLGLYKALAEAPATSTELAKKTGTDERYVREWLSSQAAGGYVMYDAKTKQFSMTEVFRSGTGVGWHEH